MELAIFFSPLVSAGAEPPNAAKQIIFMFGGRSCFPPFLTRRINHNHKRLDTHASSSRYYLLKIMPGCRTLSTHTDDYGFHNVGWRNGEMRTPTIDRLAAEGIVLERHYAFHFCSPSRSSFLSGESHKHYTYSNIILTRSYRDSWVEAARWPMRALSTRSPATAALPPPLRTSPSVAADIALYW